MRVGNPCISVGAVPVAMEKCYHMVRQDLLTENISSVSQGEEDGDKQLYL